MEKLTTNFILLLLLGSKDIWCKTIDHEIHQVVDNSDKIVGGEDAEIDDYPYQASLLMNDGREYYQCGGSIVSAYYILTAAHCLTGIKFIEARIGSTNTNSGGTMYNTTIFYFHPMYNDRTSDFDVGIVVINEGMELDGYYARAISMVKTGNDPQDEQFMIITGWGHTVEGGTISENLQKAMVPVVSREDCNEQIGGITSRMFCAGFEEGGVDTCQGDSGGPAVLSSNRRLAGITSHGFGCARPNSPGVYTRIGHFLIRKYIRFMTGV